jgi:secondary thiamine-phosphate synthase enzyme
VPVHGSRFTLSTRGETDIIDITDKVAAALAGCGIADGLVTVFVSGSTAGVTTVEYESGLVEDLRECYERVAPREGRYAHNARWGDGNGYAHVRASMTGQSFTVPLADGRLQLGTWQQIILIDFDNRPRTRTVLVQVIG